MSGNSLIHNMLDRVLSRLGYRREQLSASGRLPDVSDEDMALVRGVDEFTMTSVERRYHLLQAVRHVVQHAIPGAFVECGVWRGGSMMLAAQALRSLGAESRELYLYDTFEGMPPPTEMDKDYSDRTASERMDADKDMKSASVIWAIAGLDEVKHHMSITGYPAECIRYLVGKVEDTIPAEMPSQIALLRLDTDWYESTAHELKHLYPLVVSGGVVIIDDYGYWQGARRAVDEFLEASPDKILLHRIDDTARAFVKP